MGETQKEDIMQKLLEKDDEVKDLNPLHSKKKTYADEIKDMMIIRSFARPNPFASPDQWMKEDFDLLRERAKIYMSRREWERALLNLNRTLYNWGAKVPEQYDHNDPPNKQSLLLRCKIRLLLCENENALSDAIAILQGLEKNDYLYSKGLAMQGDALFQMGHFEHALVIYHRGNRIRHGTDEEFKLGIQKATASIHNCFRNVKRKSMHEMEAENGGQRPPLRKGSTLRQHSQQWQPKKSNVEGTSNHLHPFKDDIKSLARMVKLLQKEEKSSDVERMTDETLTYLKSRETLWKSQTTATKDKDRIIDFSPENLAQFYEDDQMTLKKTQEEIEEDEEKD